MCATRLTDRKRDDILKAALSEFEINGFKDTSMDRIAERAQVSKRTVYNHFASKDQLFDAIAAELMERVLHVSQRCYEPDQPLDIQLRAIGAQVLEMQASQCFVTLAKVTLGELIRSPELAKKTYELMRQRDSGLVTWIREATNDGRLQVDDAVWAADQFLGLLKSFALWPQLLGGQAPPGARARQHILDTTVAMFLGRYAKSKAPA